VYNINWKIQFEAQATKKVYELAVLYSCEIIHDEEQLTDTAKIKLPAFVLNNALKFESTLQRGDRVAIWMGYNENPVKSEKLINEFNGFIKEISFKDDILNIDCEDEIYAFRKPLKDIILPKKNIKQIAELIIAELKLDIKVESNITVTYDKFQIKANTGYDILKKIQEETKLDVYIKDKVLYISALYLNKRGEVIYDFAKNIEKGDLTYKIAEQKDVEVEITYTDDKGKVHKYYEGKPGGTKIEVKAPTSDEKTMRQLAQQALIKNSRDAYEGSITGWLIPYVETGYTAVINDDDYPKKTGSYYVKKTTTTISENGGVRKIDLGIKLSKPTEPE